MKKIVTGLGCLILTLMSGQQLFGQTNPDDYWLNNGFTSGQTVYTNSGFFYDDGGNGLYQAGQNWDVVFCSENGNPITVDFSGFRTDYRGPWPPLANSYLAYDYLSIQTSIPPVVVAYNDDTPQFSFTSPDGCISFGFISQNTSIPDSGWVGEISADPAPVNNDPCDAIDVPVGNSCSPAFYTNKGAYNTTNLGSPACHPYYGGDVWFTVTVPVSGEVKIETLPGSLNYAIMALYSGNCNSLSAISCVDNISTMPSAVLTGRTPGEIIYIRIFGDQAKSGTFGICATDPSVGITGFTGPGGVGDSSSNEFWYRADSGLLDGTGTPVTDGNPVAEWEDQSGNNNSLLQAGASNRPVLNAALINSMPAVSFDGIDDQLGLSAGVLSSPLNLFAVVSFSSGSDETMMSVGDANENNTFSISKETDNRYYSYSFSAKNYGPLLGTDPLIINPVHSALSSYHNLNLNAFATVVTDYASAMSTNGEVKIGSSKDDDRYFSGDIAEILMYSKSLNTAQEIIVNNYLAAKYNINIGSSDKYDYESGFQYDVAGIGRIDIDNVHSKARSADILAIGGADDLEDGEFVHFGHDNGGFVSWSTSGVPLSDPNIQRLERVWRVDLNGGDGPGAVDLSVNSSMLPALPSGFDSYNLVVDADGDFTSGADVYGLAAAGNELIANEVNLYDGGYIAVMCTRNVVSFTSASGSGLESVSHPVISVSFNFPVSGQIDIGYRVSGGTATPGGTDFSLNDDVLSFNPGDLELEIIPFVNDDSILEIPDEFFEVELFNLPAGIDIGTNSTYVYTILDNDIEIEVTATDTTIGECSSSTTTLNAAVSGQPPFSYSWTPSGSLVDPGEAVTVANPTVSTRYYVSVTDGLSNTYTDSIDIVVVPAPLKPSVTVIGSTEFCSGDSVILRSDSATSYLWSGGQTSREIIVKNTGSYTVTAIDEFGCASPVSDAVEITVNSLPPRAVITASGNTTFCDGDSVKLSVPVADGYLWSTGETSREITVLTGGNYTVQISDANTCLSPASDPLTVTVNAIPAKPLVTVTGDTEFCEGGSVILETGMADGFLWSTGETTRSIIVSDAGKYAVQITDANSCTSLASDSIEVIVNALPVKPVVSAPGDTEFCDGGSVELTVPAADSYLWSTGETTQNIIVSTSGKYAVVVTDVNSCNSPASDSIEVIVNSLPPRPTIIAGGNTTFCDGDSVKLSVPVADGYLWSTGETTREITVMTGGNYTVQVSDANSCISPASDPLSITVNANPSKPVISVTGSTEICEGGSVILDAGLAEGFLWSTGETTQSITVEAAGKYAVVITDIYSCISPASDSTEVIVNALPSKPVASALGITEFCDGGSVELTVPAADSYLWSTGETTQNIIVSASGKYAVIVTDANSCDSPASDSIEVIVNPLPAKPVISYIGDTELCEGENIILSAPEMSAYLWSTGATTREIIVGATGDYSLEVWDVNSCKSAVSDPVSITVNNLPPVPSITADGPLEFCEGGQLTLSSDIADSYLWSNGETTRSVVIENSGNYSVTVRNAAGCENSSASSVIVTVNAIPNTPVITPSGPVSVITGDSILLTSTPADTYLWSEGSTTQSVYIKESGSYTVVVTDVNSCSSLPSDAVIVNVADYYPAPAVSVDGDIEFCQGGSVNLVCDEFDSYLWSNGESTRSISVSVTGSYTVVGKDADGRESLPSDPVVITVNALPEFSVNGENTSCFAGNDGSATVNILSAAEPVSVLWSNSASGMNTTGLLKGSYDVTVTDNNGCESTAGVEIGEPDDISVSTVVTLPLCPDASDGAISATITGGSGSYSLLWNNGETGSQVNNLEPGYYMLEINDANNCQKEWEVNLAYENELCFEIPTIITPNDDGKNDEWFIDGLEFYPDVTVEVFDRWGKRVFYSKGYDRNWDGKLNGKDLPVESYHFVIDLHNGRPPIIGNITIVR